MREKLDLFKVVMPLALIHIRQIAIFCIASFVMLNAHAADYTGPIADAHLHYNLEAWDGQTGSITTPGFATRAFTRWC